MNRLPLLRMRIFTALCAVVLLSIAARHYLPPGGTWVNKVSRNLESS